jgi:hypothetical protein
MDTFDTLSKGQAYTSISLNIFKSPSRSVVMTSFDRYNVGRHAYQQNTWMANLNGVGIWSQSGVFLDLERLNISNPAVTQRDNILLAVYYMSFTSSLPPSPLHLPLPCDVVGTTRPCWTMPSISSGPDRISRPSIARILLGGPSSPPLHPLQRTPKPLPSSPRPREPWSMSSGCSAVGESVSRTTSTAGWGRWRGPGGSVVGGTCSWVSTATSPPKRTTPSAMTRKSRYPPCPYPPLPSLRRTDSPLLQFFRDDPVYNIPVPPPPSSSPLLSLSLTLPTCSAGSASTGKSTGWWWWATRRCTPRSQISRATVLRSRRRNIWTSTRATRSTSRVAGMIALLLATLPLRRRHRRRTRVIMISQESPVRESK